MRLTQNIKAISGLSLIVLILASAIIGALLSYMWAVGYYENLRIRIPEKSDVTITNATFFPQDTTFFNVTILNPSYSPSDANIKRITVLTESNVSHTVREVYPTLPFNLRQATMYFPGNQTFECRWDWANYTGETVGIVAFLADGSGPTFEIKTPLVDLSITEIDFDPSISVTRFNMTVENSNSSITHVDVSKITVSIENEVPQNVTQVTPTLPYPLYPNDSVPLVCSWDWTEYQGGNVTIVVETTQGYLAYYPQPPERTTLPPRTDIQIIDILFDAANTTCFNITIRNSEDSPTYVNITSIDITVENETFPDLPVTPPPDLPYTLYPGTNVTFKCGWNWTRYREKTGEIFIHTLQDFTESRIITTTGRVILTITDASFDVTDTEHFDLTVQNSQFSLEDYANITSIILKTVEESWLVTRTDPDYANYTLYPGTNVTFKCGWNWKNYRCKDVNITVLAHRGNQSYHADFTTTTPQAVIWNITKVYFNLSDTTHFNVTIENSQFSLDYVFIMNIATTLEDGTARNVTVVPSRALPRVLYPDQSASFMCLWDWSEYRGENFTVTVYTQQEYSAESTLPMPFVITEVLFDTTDTEHFTMIIQNSATSITHADTTGISVTVEDGAPEDVTQVTPALPYTLYPNESESFVCTWNWTNYEGRNITIALHTLQSYTAYAMEVTPERVVLEVVDVLFNVTDTAHFNITVGSSELSLIEANITEIPVTIDGIVQNVTKFVPLLPYILQPGANVTFKCWWNWTDYQGQMVTITIRTSRGYVTSAECTIPTVP